MLVPLERPNFSVRFESLEEHDREIRKLVDKTYADLDSLQLMLKFLGEEISKYPDANLRSAMKQNYDRAMAEYQRFDKADNKLQNIYRNTPELQPYGKQAALGYQTDDDYLNVARDKARVDLHASPQTLAAIKACEREIVGSYKKMQEHLKAIWMYVGNGHNLSRAYYIPLP